MGVEAKELGFQLPSQTGRPDPKTRLYPKTLTYRSPQIAPGLLFGLADHKAGSLSTGKAEKGVSPQAMSLWAVGSSIQFPLPAVEGHL